MWQTSCPLRAYGLKSIDQMGQTEQIYPINILLMSYTYTDICPLCLRPTDIVHSSLAPKKVLKVNFNGLWELVEICSTLINSSMATRISVTPQQYMIRFRPGSCGGCHPHPRLSWQSNSHHPDLKGSQMHPDGKILPGLSQLCCRETTTCI